MAGERKTPRKRTAPAVRDSKGETDEVAFSFAPSLLQALHGRPPRDSDTLDVFIAFRGAGAEDLLAAQLRLVDSPLRVLLDDAAKLARERHVSQPYGVDFDARGRSPFIKYDPAKPLAVAPCNFIAATVPAGKLVALRDASPPSAAVVADVRLAAPVYPQLAWSVPDIGACADRLPLRDGVNPYDGSGVVVAVIDFGCDFAHGNFRRPDGSTRLLAIWDQNAPDAPSPPRVGFGRELLAPAIDEALQAEHPYMALGYDPDSNGPRPDVVGAHGTHVMDIAAGNGRTTGAPGVAPGADLVFVHVKAPPKGAGWEFAVNEARVLEALQYVFVDGGFDQRPDGTTRPIVVNMSLAHSRGPHDGSGLLEQTIDALLSQPGRAVVLAAGNDFARDRHAAGPALPGVPRVLRWEFARLGGDPPSWNVLDAFLDESAGVATVEIEPPGGDAVVVPSSGAVDLMIAGAKVGEVAAQSLGPGRRDIEVRVDHRGIAETWTLRITAGANPVPFDAWIDCLYSEQSAFALGDSCHLSTLSTIGTGKRAIVVGAYDALSPTLRAAAFTAAGPSLNPDADLRRKPDISAPGISVRAARSKGGRLKVPGKPWRTPASVVKSGTSMAAPHVAGTIALMLEKKPAATIDAIRRALIDTARKDPPARPPTAPPSQTWDPVYGFGRLDAAKAIERL